MSGWLSLTILMVVIFHICTTATESISSLDTMAIYDGLLAPENIIGTNLQVTKMIVNGQSRSSLDISWSFCVDHLSIIPTERRVQQCNTQLSTTTKGWLCKIKGRCLTVYCLHWKIERVSWNNTLILTRASVLKCSEEPTLSLLCFQNFQNSQDYQNYQKELCYLPGLSFSCSSLGMLRSSS